MKFKILAAVLSFGFPIFLLAKANAAEVKAPKTLAEQNEEFEKLKDYCAKYPTATECKPLQIKHELERIQKIENEKAKAAEKLLNEN